MKRRNTLRILILSFNLFLALLCQAWGASLDLGDSGGIKRWNMTAVKKGTFADGRHFQFQGMQRLSGIDGQIYPVASLSFLWQENTSSNRLDRKQLLKDLSVGFGVEKWTIERDGPNDVYSANLTDQSRKIRLAVWQDQNQILVSTASYRLGYADAVEKEVQGLQNVWAKFYSNSSQTHKKAYIKWPLLIDQAYALDYDQILNTIDPGSFVDGQSAITTVVGQNPINGHISVDVNGNVGVDGKVEGSLNQGQFNQLNGQLTNVNNSVQQTNAQIGTANQNWANTNNQVQNANQNWANTNTQVGNANQNWANTNNQVANANQNWSNTNDVIDRNWSDTNKQLSRANDIAEKMSDPKHMFLLSGATAAGAVFGSAAASLAIDGMKMGLEWIIEQLTDSKGKANRWALFAEARKNWDETIRQALNLEKAIDQFLGHYQLLQDLKNKFPGQKLTIEDIIRHFSKEIVKAKKVLKRYERDFEEASDSKCEDELADQIVHQEEVIKQLEDVSEILTHHQKENPQFDIFDERYFCSEMGRMLRNLLDAENTLQEYRIFMIDGKAEFADQIADRGERLYEKADRYNDKRESLADREKERVEDNYKRGMDQLKASAEAKCDRQDVSYFKKRNCVDSILADESSKRVADRLTRDRDQALEQIKRGYADQDANYLTVNQGTINQKMALYQDWFKELEEQQFCSQNPTDPGCQELGKFRYNGYFSVKDKAVESMGDICPQQDMRLIEVNRQLAEEAQKNRNQGISSDRSSRSDNRQVQGRSIASSSQGSSSSSSGGGFFSSLFDSVKNFFSSIGDFFSGMFGKSVGESSTPVIEQEYVQRDQVEVLDNSRSPAVAGKIEEAELTATEIIKTKYPEAYIALMRHKPTADSTDFEKVLRAIESKKIICREGMEINLNDL